MKEILSKLPSDQTFTINLSEVYSNTFHKLGTYKNVSTLEVINLVSSNRKTQKTRENIESSRSILILHFEKISFLHFEPINFFLLVQKFKYLLKISIKY
jgi:hypothetical protein